MRALAVIATYAILSLVWIGYSDAALAALVSDDATLQRFQTLKGWTFVAFSSVLIALLLVPHERRRERVRRGLQRSFDLTRAIGDAASLSDALHAGLRRIMADSPWSLAEAWLHDPERDELSLAGVSHRLASHPSAFVTRSYLTRFRAGEGLPGSAWLGNERVWLADVSLERAFVRREGAAAIGLRTGVGFPFATDDGVVAVICLYATSVVPRARALSGLDHLLVNQIGSAIATKQAEEAVRALKDDLERRVSARTAELSDLTTELDAFARTASHDLRAPLRTISALSAALDEDVGSGLSDASRHHLALIRGAADDMTALVDDLLVYSSQTRMELEFVPVDLECAVDEVLAAIALGLDERRCIDVVRPLPSVVAHDAALRLVIGNLVTNALKFVAPGVAPHVRIAAAHHGDDVRFTVTDDGIGMAMEDASRVLEPFVRLHASESYPGTGIGLAAANRAVARMRGRLAITSRLGHGTEVAVDLPAYVTRDPRASAAVAA